MSFTTSMKETKLNNLQIFNAKTNKTKATIPRKKLLNIIYKESKGLNIVSHGFYKNK